MLDTESPQTGDGLDEAKLSNLHEQRHWPKRGEKREANEIRARKESKKRTIFDYVERNEER